MIITQENLKDLPTIYEIARVALSMVFDEIGEELDLSDDELKRIQTVLSESLEA